MKENGPISDITWKELEKDLFSPEEISASNERVAAYSQATAHSLTEKRESENMNT